MASELAFVVRMHCGKQLLGVALGLWKLQGVAGVSSTPCMAATTRSHPRAAQLFEQLLQAVLKAANVVVQTYGGKPLLGAGLRTGNSVVHM